MLDVEEIRESSVLLHRVVAAVDAGELVATTSERDFLAGAVGVLDQLLQR